MFEGQKSKQKSAKGSWEEVKVGEKPREDGVPQTREKPKYFQEEGMIIVVNPTKSSKMTNH